MSKVLYKKYIPAIYYSCSRGFQGKELEKGTGKWEEEFTHPGELLHWGVAYEELESGAGNYTVALVKKPDGTVEEVLPSNMKFVDESFITLDEDQLKQIVNYIKTTLL